MWLPVLGNVNKQKLRNEELRIHGVTILKGEIVCHSSAMHLWSSTKTGTHLHSL